MKTKSFLTLFTLASFIINMSCSSTDDSLNNLANINQQQIIQVMSTAQSGVWRITSFIDSGQDETNNFTGYNFTFNSNGSLVADNGNNTVSGTWSVTNGSSSSNDIDFNIFFSVANTSDFEDLNDDWDIVTYDNNTIELIDVSGGNGGTDTLVFQQN